MAQIGSGDLGGREVTGTQWLRAAHQLLTAEGDQLNIGIRSGNRVLTRGAAAAYNA